MDNATNNKPTRLMAVNRREYRAGLIAVFAGVTALAVVRVLSGFGLFDLLTPLGPTWSEVVGSLIWPVLGGAVLPFVLYFSLGFNKKRFAPKTVASGLNGLGFGKVSVGVVLISIALGTLYSIANSGIAQVSQSIMIALGFRLRGGDGMEMGGWGYLIAMCVTSAVMPALFEEFTCRGLLLKSLSKHGEKFAIIITATVFALFHMNLTQTIYTFAMGLITAYVTIKLRTIWPAVIMHFINNFGATVLYYLYAKSLPGKEFYELVVNLSYRAPIVLLFIWAAALGLSVLAVWGLLRYNKYQQELKQHKLNVAQRRERIKQAEGRLGNSELPSENAAESADVTGSEDVESVALDTDSSEDTQTARAIEDLNSSPNLKELYENMKGSTEVVDISTIKPQADEQSYKPRFIDMIWLYAMLIVSGGATLFSIIWALL